MLLLSGNPIRDHARLEARRGRRARSAQDPARLSTGTDPFLSLDPRPRLSPRRRPIPRARASDDRAQDGWTRGIFPVPPRGSFLFTRSLNLTQRTSWPGLSHGCPVEFLWTRSTALIPLGVGRLGDVPDTRWGINAMRHQNSVFHGLMKHLPWGVFDRLVAAHGADSRVRRLSTKSQFIALLYGQLSGAA